MNSVDGNIIDQPIDEDEELALKRILDANDESCGIGVKADFGETHLEDDNLKTIHDEKPEVIDSLGSIVNTSSELEVDVNVSIGSFTSENHQIKHPDHSVNSSKPQTVINSENTIKVTSALHRLREMIDPGNEGKPGIATVFDFDLTTLDKEDKPWMQPGAKLSDYFNYSFDEESWSQYCNEKRVVNTKQEEVKSQPLDPVISTNISQNPALNHLSLENPVPVEQSKMYPPLQTQINQTPISNGNPKNVESQSKLNLYVPNVKVNNVNISHTQDNQSHYLETSVEDKNCETSYLKSSRSEDEIDYSKKKETSRKRSCSPDQAVFDRKKLKTDKRYGESKHMKSNDVDYYRYESTYKKHDDKDKLKHKTQDDRHHYRENEQFEKRENIYDDIPQKSRSRDEFYDSKRDLRNEIMSIHSYNDKRNFSKNNDYERNSGKERKYRK